MKEKTRVWGAGYGLNKQSVQTVYPFPEPKINSNTTTPYRVWLNECRRIAESAGHPQ